jgi:N-acetylmuramoyl-L-alanine amidase
MFCVGLVVLVLCCAGLMPAAFAAEAGAGAQPFTVVLDAAHGGTDTGTTLAPQLLEKNLVLSLSVRLRSALTARGMAVVTTRENDTDRSFDQRAAEANHARAGACLVLHATASGSGVHLYVSSLPLGPMGAGLVPWSSAEAPFATQSLQLASSISAALQAAGVPITLGRVRLQPLDSMRCPVVAVEIAPLNPMSAEESEHARISDGAYQQRILNALAAALVQWRAEHPGAGAGGVR